jgi:hypothetical protein
MIPALTALLIALGMFILIRKGSLPGGGGGGDGKLVLHYPATGPSPMALLALTKRSLILDRRLAVLLASGDESPLLDTALAIDHSDVRVGDAARREIAGKVPAQHLPLAVKATGAEYAALVATLEGRGVTDPHVVAEALLANVSDGSTPRLATCDLSLRERLAPAGTVPYRENAVPEPYEVSLEHRTLRVIPIVAGGPFAPVSR